MTLDVGLPVDKLRAPRRAALLGERQPISLDASNRRGKQFTCRITRTPLRGPSGEVDGAVLCMGAARGRGS